MRRLLTILAGLVLLAVPRTALATEATCGGTTDCGDVELLISAIDSSHYSVQVTWSTSTFNQDLSDYIDGVSITASGINVDFATSSVSTTAPGTWSGVQEGPLGATGSGCQATSQNSLCTDTSDALTVVSPNKTYTWTFIVETTSAFTLPTGTHVQIGFFSANTGNPNGQISQDFTSGTPSGGTPAGSSPAVPEPASLLLLGSGLGFVATRFRRGAKK